MAVAKKSLINGSSKLAKSAPTSSAKMATAKIAAGKITTAAVHSLKSLRIYGTGNN
jgi:hypothetical protein